MLYLTRKIGESIVINDTIELTVVEVRGRSVKLGFVFPPDATVLRKEIYDKIMAENLALVTWWGLCRRAPGATGRFRRTRLAKRLTTWATPAG